MAATSPASSSRAADRIGQEIWGTGGEFGYTQDGCHAEYLVTTPDSVGPKPEVLSLEEAAAAGTNYMAAWAGLVDAAQMKPGETVVVIGASGGVGTAVVQIAKWKGVRVIGVERREPTPAVGPLKADMTINSSAQDVREAVRAATNGKGAEIVYDCVGGPQFEVSLSLLKHGGRLLEISSTGSRRVTFDLVDFYHNESRLFGVDTLHYTGRQCAELLANFVPAFEQRLFQAPLIARTYALEQVVEAYEAVAGRNVSGKVLLLPQKK